MKFVTKIRCKTLSQLYLGLNVETEIQIFNCKYLLNSPLLLLS